MVTDEHSEIEVSTEEGKQDSWWNKIGINWNKSVKVCTPVLYTHMSKCCNFTCHWPWCPCIGDASSCSGSVKMYIFKCVISLFYVLYKIFL